MNAAREEAIRGARAFLMDLEAFGIDALPRVPGAEAVSAPSRDAEVQLGEIARRVAECRRCGLCETRGKVVPGQGASTAEILFIGEAPGADEDRAGLAFVGPAGQLLTKMIAAMGFSRDEVFIANILKCRPPRNRDPEAQEVASCLPFLHEQIAAIRPKILVTLGAYASRNLLQSTLGIGRLRGRVSDYRGIPLVATYHPAYLLRSPEQKKAAWQDLQLVLRELGRPVPSGKRS